MEINVLLFDDAELLDWAGPVEVFQSAGRFTKEPVTIRYLGYGNQRIHSGGLVLYCNGLWGGDRKLFPELVILPGGSGVERLYTDITKSNLQNFLHSGTTIASVCTGSLLLAYAGLLSGRNATTHHENMDQLARMAPDCHIQRNVRYTESSPVYTAAGVSAGIDLALRLVALNWGLDLAKQTANFMEYPTDGIEQSKDADN